MPTQVDPIVSLRMRLENLFCKLVIKYLLAHLQKISHQAKKAVLYTYSMSVKRLKYQVPELIGQGIESSQDHSEFLGPTIDISLVHFSPSGKIRLQKLQRSSNFHQKSWKSENSLVALFNQEETASSDILKHQDTKDQLSVPSQSCHTFGRRKSMSLNNIPLALLSTSTLQSQGGSATSPLASTNLDVSSLKSSKSIQMLSGEDIKCITRNIREERITPAPLSDRALPVPPVVPKRRTAFLENCTVTDYYLIQQGKRLSGLPFDHSIADEQKRHSKSFFTRVGGILKKVGSSNNDSVHAQETQSCVTAPHISEQKNTGSVQDMQLTSS